MNASERSVLARLDRRRIVRAGGLAGAAGLLAAPAVARGETTLTVEVAEDVSTFRLNPRNGGDGLQDPVVGDTFIEFGTIYPAGTIAKGLTSPHQPGAIGRWVCRGTFPIDAASGGSPQVITTVLIVFGDGITATAGDAGAAPDALLTEGYEGTVEPVRRIVVGGYGRYAGVRGELLQTPTGENDSVLDANGIKIPGGNFTMTFTFVS